MYAPSVPPAKWPPISTVFRVVVEDACGLSADDPGFLVSVGLGVSVLVTVKIVIGLLEGG